MTKTSFWQEMAPTRYFTILIILIIAFLVLTLLAVFFNTLWTISLSLPWILAALIAIYIDARVERDKLAQFITSFIFIFIMNYLAIHISLDMVPQPFYFIAATQYIIGLTLIMTITIILGERYLKPQLIKPSNHTE